MIILQNYCSIKMDFAGARSKSFGRGRGRGIPQDNSSKGSTKEMSMITGDVKRINVPSVGVGRGRGYSVQSVCLL